MYITLTDEQAIFLDSLFGLDKDSVDSFEGGELDVLTYNYNINDESYDDAFGTVKGHSIEITELIVIVMGRKFDLTDKDPIIELTSKQWSQLEEVIDRHCND